MGKIFKFNQDVDTDQIIASQYIIYPTIDEMKGHTFESLDPNFASQVQPGDFVVASENFGCGSSREQAPRVSKQFWQNHLRGFFIGMRLILGFLSLSAKICTITFMRVTIWNFLCRRA